MLGDNENDEMTHAEYVRWAKARGVPLPSPTPSWQAGPTLGFWLLGVLLILGLTVIGVIPWWYFLVPA